MLAGRMVMNLGLLIWALKALDSHNLKSLAFKTLHPKTLSQKH